MNKSSTPNTVSAAARRTFLVALAGVAGSVMFAGGSIGAKMQNRLKIGVIGSGRIGGTVGGLWVKAGHEVRHDRG